MFVGGMKRPENVEREEMENFRFWKRCELKWKKIEPQKKNTMGNGVFWLQETCDNYFILFLCHN